MEEWKKLGVGRKTGREWFRLSGKECGFDLLEFWQWSVSDLVSNATRGRLAEFIVAKALGIATDGVRDEWQAYDLITPAGTKLEVKSAAYIQSWHQTGPSRIGFSIAESRFWDGGTNELGTEVKRQADVYVFALLKHEVKTEIDPLNLDQWEFYVVATEVLNERFKGCRSISLAKLQGAAGKAVGFGELKSLMI